MQQEPRPARWPTLLVTAVLTVLVFTFFAPIRGFEFVDLDVPVQVIDNTHVHGLTPENLKHVFTSPCISSFYPVRTLTYAVDYEIWGLDPGGFKLTNALIHAANVLLVFWLILRLLRHPAAGGRSGRSAKASWDVCVATFSAGIFAVHPVVVEPVTWVAGREELLMTLGALGCIHSYITARLLGQDGGSRRRAFAWYLAAALFCAAACLSNAVGAVIPLLIAAWDSLTLDRPRFWKIVRGTALFWAMAAATIVIKIITQTSTPDLDPVRVVSAAIQKYGYTGEATVPAVETFSVDRLNVILNVYWLNLRALFRPTDLALSYGSVRPSSFLEFQVILGGIAAGLTCLALWLVRRRTLILVGLVWFCIALGPSAQIMPHHIDRADRFLYLPLVGLAVALGAGLRPLGSILKRRVTMAAAIAVGGLGLFLLDRVGANQLRTWQTNFSVWQNSANVCTDSPLAHAAFARALACSGDFERAFEHYRAALEIDACDAITVDEYALYLATCDEKELRDYEAAIRLATWACELSGWKQSEMLRTLATAYGNFGVDLQQSGDFGRAVECFNKAIQTDPEYATPMFNLALLLATCGDAEFRQPDEAVRLVDAACQMTANLDANNLWIVAAVYAQVGRSETVIGMMEKAILAAEAEGNLQLADRLRRQLKLYRDGLLSESSPD